MKEGPPFRPANPTEPPGPIPTGPNPNSWKSPILNWGGALAAAALIVVPLWMLLSNPAVLGGHPALPALLVAAVALGIFWSLLLVRRRLFGDKQQRSGDISTWQLVRGIAGRLTVLGLVAALMWLSPFPHQPDREKTVPANGSSATAPAGPRVAEDATSITLAPAGTATTGLVFYPGARVDAHAYQDLLQPLAAAGHLVVILKVPLGVSLLDTNQARAAMDRHPEVESWAVGGHSLGGVSASSFAASNHDVAGLLLFASYPAGTMTDAQGLSVLSISGSNDGLSTPDKIAASRSQLPPTTAYVTVVGGVHAFFGDYGEQPGDGDAGISRNEAQQQIVAESLRFMDRLKASG